MWSNGRKDEDSPGQRVSRDGIRFDTHYVLADAEYAPAQPGLHKGRTYAYPHTLIRDGHLCVIVSVGKESVMALRVALADL